MALTVLLLQVAELLGLLVLLLLGLLGLLLLGLLELLLLESLKNNDTESLCQIVSASDSEATREWKWYVPLIRRTTWAINLDS